MQMQRRQLVCGLMTAILAGCSDTGPVADPPVPVATSAPATGQGGDVSRKISTVPQERRFGGIRLTVPAGWEEVPLKSDMLLAEYKLEGDAGPGRLTLSTAGGGVEANISRWRGQFSPGEGDPSSAESTLTVDGHEAAVVELFGSFQDGFGGGGVKPGWAMLGVVLPLKQANFFCKLTGPRATIEAQKEAVLEFVKSAKFED